MLYFWFEAICLCARKESTGNVVHFQAFLTPHRGKSVKSRRDVLQTLLSAKERLEKATSLSGVFLHQRVASEERQKYTKEKP